ncbi:phenylacetaldoxime dehydratase family protein [Streptomyces sp. NPDC058086]|uniref:phenylacetaldoxime dehydratase family protein n=1 Tax=Streptomyces sp. NPDC058086 TaxID=3346334 RepID=UPI0036EE66B1
MPLTPHSPGDLRQLLPDGRRRRGALDVAFGHEVSVLPRGAVTTEYVNCHRVTGFLPLTADHHSTITA